MEGRGLMDSHVTLDSQALLPSLTTRGLQGLCFSDTAAAQVPPKPASRKVPQIETIPSAQALDRGSKLNPHKLNCKNRLVSYMNLSRRDDTAE